MLLVNNPDHALPLVSVLGACSFDYRCKYACAMPKSVSWEQVMLLAAAHKTKTEHRHVTHFK